MLTKIQILEKLKTIDDPELHVNIVDLGLIYDVKVDGKGNVRVKMTLTSPGCPLSSRFEKEVRRVVKAIGGVKDVQVDLAFDPPWDPSRMTKEAKLKLGYF